MELWSLNKAKYAVYSITEGKAGQISSPTLHFLNTVPADMSSHAIAMRALFQRYADGGSGNLTRQMFHDAGGDGIEEFRHGRLRIYCFRDPDDGSVILLSHGQVKKSGKRGNKTPIADLNAAKAARDLYLDSKLRNEITIKEVPKDEAPQRT